MYNLDGPGIQDKVDTYLGDNAQKVDGLERLIEYLDSIYSDDAMSEDWSKYKRFNQLMKDQNQSVTVFIAEFDKGHAKAKESVCVSFQTRCWVSNCWNPAIFEKQTKS